MSQMNSGETEAALTRAGHDPRRESPANPNTEGDRLERLLPQIRELAQKVGGYDKLAELARELNRGGG